MTDSQPTHPDEPNNDAPAMDQETAEFAGKIFNLVRSGTPADAQLLVQYIEAGVPVDLTNEDGNTLLMLAAYSGNTDAVRGLIRLGADVNKLNLRNQSIIAGALFKGEDEIVHMLRNAGASLTIGHPTAIDTARMFGKSDLLA